MEHEEITLAGLGWWLILCAVLVTFVQIPASGTVAGALMASALFLFVLEWA